jgi:hypothetical protein
MEGPYDNTPGAEIVGRVFSNVESFPMQDEPEQAVCFQYRMSLKRMGMLRIEDQRAGGRETEPGADPGVFGSQ